jgi:uncharacterized SAM-binding protein YcdF (DUF218 family)
MFFILSKTLDYFMLPLVWIMCIFLYAIFTKNQKHRKKSLITGVALIFFLGNGFISNEAYYLWQINPVPVAKLPVYQTAVVLTGIVPYQDEDLNDRVHFGQGADRLLHAIQLYKAGKVKKILISGGSGSLTGNTSSESDKLKTVFMYCGVPEADLILERTSRNTHESAENVRKITDSLGMKGNLLLITSAWHMRRAQGCYTKAGLKTDAFVVDFSKHGEFFFEQLIPTELSIAVWTQLIHEIIGYTAYKVMGYC